jgi:hypothetical protein
MRPTDGSVTGRGHGVSLSSARCVRERMQYATDISRIKARTSAGTPGRPVRCRLFQGVPRASRAIAATARPQRRAGTDQQPERVEERNDDEHCEAVLRKNSSRDGFEQVVMMGHRDAR